MKHKMWSRLLSMVLAVMMITSIVPTSAFAEAASEIAASSQAVAEVVEQTEEVTLPEDTTTEEPAAETPAQEPAAETPAEEPAGEPVPTAEPVAEPTAEPATESEQPTAEPTQAPAETAVPSEPPSAEPTAAPEGTETPEATAVPSATPVPSESPLPSETPVPTETPEATEEPVVMNEEEYTTSVTTDDGVNVEVTVPAETLPEGAVLKVDRLAEGSEGYAQAQNALSETGADGFVALDIRFEVNNEEVEPAQSVQMKVSAENLLPEDADESTVVVQHLEENEDNTVTMETVAMAAEMQENQMPQVMAMTNAIATDVQPELGTVDVAENTLTAEFTAESFSTFTITWVSGENKTELKVQCLNSNGGSIGSSDKKEEVKAGEAVRLANITITGYEFDHATVGGTEATAIRANIVWNGATYTWKFEYKRNETKQWVVFEKNDSINIYYKKVQNKPGTVETVDPDNITIKLFDYDGWESYDELKFATNNGLVPQGTTYNAWTGQHWDDNRRENVGNGVWQGIVENNLFTDNNGTKLPVLNGGGKLSTIFGGEGIDAHGLFLKSEYDATGYYFFDSNQNFAKIDQTTGEFTVYDAINNASSDLNTAARFLPFNDLKRSGNQYVTSESENFYFGMTMEFKFVQPKNGKVGEDNMVFEFDGDDDVWVFIDDVLVLDLGGIHRSSSGSIDFATGEVKVDRVFYDGENKYQDGTTNPDVTNTTIREAFAAAGYKKDQLDEIFTEDGRFKDYTEHTFNYYYLERGAGASNLKVKFNIQTIPSDSFFVGKEIVSSNADYADVKFKFKAEIKQGDNWVPYVGNYRLYKNGLNGESSGTYRTNDGTVELMHGEYAEFFEGISATTQYRVTEIGATSDKYRVSIDSTSVFAVNDKGQQVDVESDDVAGIRTEDLTVHEKAIVLFENKIQVDNQFSLEITKKMENAPENETFTMEVVIGGKKYSGTYEVKSKDGSSTLGNKADNGKITLEAGQTAIIRDLVGGTSVQVTEVGLGDQYNAPEYKIEGAIDPASKNQNGRAYAVALEGKELEQHDYAVTVEVTNSLKGGNLTVKKTVTGLENDPDALQELMNTLTFTVTDATGKEVEVINMNTQGWEDAWDGDSFSYTLEQQLPAGTYTVRESGHNQLDGYQWTSGDVSASAQVSDGQTTEVSLTNNYERAIYTLTIKKNLSGLANYGKPVFDFKVTDTGTGDVWYFHIEIPEESLNQDVFVGELELPAGGTYRVEELANQNYKFVKLTQDDVIINPGTGAMTREKEVTNGGEIVLNKETELVFFNEPRKSNIPTDGSGAKNEVTRIDGGMIIWKKTEYGADRPNNTQ